MRNLLQHLAKECNANKITEKILIVPSYSIGHQLLESLALSGTSVINCRISTVLGLVMDCVNEELLKKKATLISDETRLSLVEESFRNSIYGKKGFYFDELEPGPGIISALSASINDLRLAEVASKDLKRNQFVSEEKFNGVSLLLKKYEDYIASDSRIDEAGVYQLLLQKPGLVPTAERMYFILPDIELKPLQKKCLEKISNGNYTVLERELIVDLKYPQHFIKSSSTSPSNSQLSWLVSPAKKPKGLNALSMDFFHAVGISTESKEVLRRIYSKRISFDQVEIACVDYSTYSYQFFLEQQKQNIPITFSDGVPCQHSRPGKALLGLFDWIESDYSVTSLRRLIASNVIKRKEYKEEKSLSSQEIIRILRSAGIGWGRDRYLIRLEALKKKYEKDCESDTESDNGVSKSKEKLKEKIKRIELVAEFVEDLLSCIPNAPSEKMAVKDFIAGLTKFCDRFCSQQDELDRLAYSTLKSVIAECGLIVQSEKMLDELIDSLRVNIETLLIGGSGPKPGHIHISSIPKAGYNSCSTHFILGLDEHRFPGTSMDDPVLLDSERRLISADLNLSDDTSQQKTYRAYAYLSSLSGEITLSYSSYDIVESREVFPSPLFLEAYRIASGKTNIDYSTLRDELGDPVGYQGSTPIDETEWWLKSLLVSNPPDSKREKVLYAFPSIARGMEALEERSSEQFTAFDGKVNVDAKVVDPRTNKNLVMSCSRIEKIANCPFDYFVTEILGLSPPDDIEFDASQWVDPATRGTLLHDIFEEFMRSVRDTKEKVSAAKHRKLLFQIAEQHIQLLKDAVPPPSEHVFNDEKNVILGDLEIFLKMEDQRPSNEIPRYFELSFGMPDKGEKGEIGTDDPIRITLGKNSFLLRGRIDRIDKVGEQQYQVIDYKTGSAYGYTARGYFHKGTRIQHCLYARAAETMLQTNADKKAKVTLSGYYFPTKKGKAELFMRRQDRPAEVNEVINLLFDIISSGVFLHSKEGCFLCKDYGLCEDTKAHHALKTENEADPGITLLNTLANYD